MSEIDELKSRIDELEIDNAYLRKMLKSYEDIMKLTDREIDNDESIIEMYEQIMEFERSEKKVMSETAKAFEQTSELSRGELSLALRRIRELESENAELKKLRSDKE